MCEQRSACNLCQQAVAVQPSDRRGLQADTPWPLDEEQAVKMYRAMVGLQTMDVVFYDSQRQARTTGEPLQPLCVCCALSGGVCSAWQIKVCCLR